MGISCFLVSFSPVQTHRRSAFRDTTWTANSAVLSAQDSTLVAYWKAEGISDSKGSHTLTNVGTATYTAGKYNNALTLNGSSQYFTAVDDSDFDYGSGEFTIACWFNRSATGVDHNIYHQLANVGQYASPVTIQITSGNKLKILTSTNGTSWTTTGEGSTTINATTWYHLVIVGDGTDIKGYINDSLEVTLASVGTLFNATQVVELGAYTYSGGTVNHFNGQLDELAVWKGYGADSAFISALYNSGTGSFYLP